MTATIRQRLLQASAHLHAALRAWCGDDDYERYLQSCAERREVPLDRGRYFARRLEERYRSTGRCC